MKNAYILIVFLIVFIASIIREPISDSIDAIAGATNDTYGPAVDSIAGVSYEEDDDEDEYEEEDDD